MVKFKVKDGKVFKVVEEKLENEELEKCIDEDGFYDVNSLIRVVTLRLFGDIFEYEHELLKNIEISKMYDEDYLCEECMDNMWELWDWIKIFVDKYGWNKDEVVWDEKYYKKIYKYYKLVMDMINKDECFKK